jgi:competence protein ComEC
MTPLRPSVHAAAGHRLGAADPRQESPPDLRLVPPALAAWAAAALALGTGGPAAAAGAAACCLAAVVLLITARSRGHGASASLLVAVAMTLLCTAAGATSAALHAADLRRGPIPRAAEQYAHTDVELTVTGDPWLTRPRVSGAEQTPGVVVMHADATWITATDGTGSRIRTPVLVIVPTERRVAWLRLLPSTELRVRARIAPPQDSGPGPQDIAAVLRVRGDDPPRVLGGPTAVQHTAGELRAGLRAASDGLPPDARALLPGLVVGDTSRIPPDLDAAFRATDLTHLLAVSGANLTLVLVLLIGPPGTASRAERRGLAPRLGIPLRTTAVLGALLTLAFVVVCRPDPSVLRAAACGLITILAIATGRRRSLIPALAAAVLLLVLTFPRLATDFGFLLSVLATGSLLTVAPRWSAALRRGGMPGRPAEALAAAAAAQTVCAPVVAVLAAHVSLVAIPCNLLAELAVAPATVLGFAALATAPVALEPAKCLAWLAGWPTEAIAAVARTGAALPGAEIGWPGSWSGALILAGVTALVLLLGRRVLRHPWLAAACALLLLLVVLRPAPLGRVITGWPPPGWRLVACDVGQGDALVIDAGPGTALVIDTGPDPEAMDGCLRDLGIRRVPLLVLTHFHADHVTGLPGVLRGRAVGAIQTSTVRDTPEQAAAVDRIADEAEVPVISAIRGERRRIGPELSWEVLWPPADAAGYGSNDSSVTLLLKTAGLTVFLPGDLEPPAQQRLLAERADLPRVDVLKVAHHGSAYQHPALLRRLSPGLAVISCGENNYGHPAPVTLAALRAAGATVLRTDTDGAVAVTGTDGRAHAVRSPR